MQTRPERPHHPPGVPNPACISIPCPTTPHAFPSRRLWHDDFRAYVLVVLHLIEFYIIACEFAVAVCRQLMREDLIKRWAVSDLSSSHDTTISHCAGSCARASF